MLGLDRWVARVAGYVLLMRDEYPPFRLDQGGSGEPLEAAVATETATEVAAAEPSRGGGTAGRIVLIVVGTIAGVIALGLLAGGCALVGIDRTQRDDDGFVMSPSQDLDSPTYAIVSESAELDTDGAEWALDTFLGTVRIRSESDRAVFVGIGPAAEVDRYLEGVEHDVIDDLDRAEIRSTRCARAAPSGLPPGPRRSGPRPRQVRASRRSSGIPRTASGGRS